MGPSTRFKTLANREIQELDLTRTKIEEKRQKHIQGLYVYTYTRVSKETRKETLQGKILQEKGYTSRTKPGLILSARLIYCKELWSF